MYVLEQLHRHAAERGDNTAVKQVAPACVHVEPLTYARLAQFVNGTAATLASKSSPGDVAILQCPNAPVFVVAFLAALQADLVIFPVHAQATEFELNAAAETTRAKIYMAGEAMRSRASALDITFLSLVDIYSCDGAKNGPARGTGACGAMLLQSSGTTGTPRIVRRSARSLDAVARNVQNGIGLTSDDRVLAAIPLYHSYGVEHGLLAPIAAGSSVHMADGFDPATMCDQLAGGDVTVFPAVPFMIEALGQRVSCAPALRRVYSAGAPLPVGAYQSFVDRTGARVGQVYGSTEAGSLTFNNPERSDFDPASVGQPLDGVQFRIVDPDAPNTMLQNGEVGEVTVRAPSMLEKYINDDVPLIDGFLRTGDLGRVDAAGNLTIVGRVKLQIDIGGAKINPLEIERIIQEFPGVEDCAVVAVRVSDTVDRLKAVIVPAKHQPFAAEELRAYLRERVSPYKVPRVFELRASLPKSVTGKILREALHCE